VPRQAGVSLVEVLVAMVILAIGLLALVVLHGRLHVLQVESYQRSEALVILNDMANRIQLNRNAAALYVTAAPLGTGMNCNGMAAGDARGDRRQGMVRRTPGFRRDAGRRLRGRHGRRARLRRKHRRRRIPRHRRLAGHGALSAPPASVSCGAGEYDGAAGTACVDDLCRRVVTTVVRIATLT
jgi:type IV pilus assembly protein PilV